MILRNFHLKGKKTGRLEKKTYETLIYNGETPGN